MLNRAHADFDFGRVGLEPLEGVRGRIQADQNMRVSSCRERIGTDPRYLWFRCRNGLTPKLVAATVERRKKSRLPVAFVISGSPTLRTKQ